MKIQKLSAWAAIAWLPVGLLGIFVIILREQAGVTNPYSGEQVLRFLTDHQLLYKLSPLTGAAAGCLLIAAVLGIHDWIREFNVKYIRLGSIFGLVAGGMFLLSGMIGITGGEMLQHAYQEGTSSAASAYLPILVVADSAGTSGMVSFGLWLLILGFETLQFNLLPRVLEIIMILGGILLIATVLNLIAGVIGSFIAMICMPWLGIFLLNGK